MPMLQHPQPAQHAADDARPQPRVLGDDADLRLGEAHVEIERRRQRGGHAVAQLVEEDEREHEQRLLPAGAREEFAERLDHRLGQRARTGARELRLVDDQRHRDPGQHEQRGDPVHAGPRQVIGEDQRERARHEARDPVRVDVDRVAETQLDVGQDFAAIRVEHDVLARAEERDRRRPDRRSPTRPAAGGATPNSGMAASSSELRDQHPAAAPAERGERVAVEQRRPQELPRVRQLDQREEPDRLQVDVLRAQPRRQQVDEQVERQARRESGEDADQHPPVEERLAPRFARRAGRSTGCGGRLASADERERNPGSGCARVASRSRAEAIDRELAAADSAAPTPAGRRRAPPGSRR